MHLLQLAFIEINIYFLLLQHSRMSAVIDFIVQSFDTLSDVVHEVKYFVIILLTPNQISKKLDLVV